MNTDIDNLKTITVFRSSRLKHALSQGALNIVAGGASRGGTSAVACVMRTLGCQMGENLHPFTHEDLDFVDLVNFANFDNDIWRTLAEEKLNASPGWSIKLPAAFQMLHVWEEVLPNPFYVLIIRNPFTVAKSLVKWDEDYQNSENDYFNGYSHAISMYAECLGKIGGIAGSYCICEYEKIISDPLQFVSDLASICGFNLDPELTEKCVALISESGYKEVV